jgi:ATP-binding cassette, subfamily C (CFTR/MRP), member 1
VVKDERTKLTGEILKSIQSIKMHSWEEACTRMISELRAAELRTLQAQAVANACLVCLMQSTPAILTAVSFGVLIWRMRVLDSQLVFTSILIFTMLNASLIQLSSLLSSIQILGACLGRVRDYLNAPETSLIPLAGSQNESCINGTILGVKEVRLEWQDGSIIIDGGDLHVATGDLAVITGPAGFGKTTLLAAITRYIETLGERKPTVAYCPQQPFLTSGTIRDNILFGKQFDQDLYEKVVFACCLGPDLQQLPQGDRTVTMGSTSLSGGQKARIALARAVYSQANIYVLDDPFAAVDSAVQRLIIQRLLGRNGFLAKSTRIIATNNELVINEASVVNCLESGVVKLVRTTTIESGINHASHGICGETLSTAATVRTTIIPQKEFIC